MALGTTKSSTQDTNTGTPVATAVNEDVGATALQATVPMGNKTTYSETSRTGVSSADTATTDLTTSGFASSGLIDAGNALTLAIRAACDTASKTLTGRVIFYDGSSNPIAFSESIIFTSDASLTIAGSGQKFPSARQLVDCGQGRKVKLYIDTVSGGTWDLSVRPI